MHFLCFLTLEQIVLQLLTFWERFFLNIHSSLYYFQHMCFITKDHLYFFPMVFILFLSEYYVQNIVNG